MVTIEEYLEMERSGTEKSEYYKGEIFTMSGAKISHNRIASNLLINLGNKLKGKGCHPYGSDFEYMLKRTHCLHTRT
jgi:Uma2 family endonuclease